MNTPIVLIALAVFLLMLAFVLRPFRKKRPDMDEWIDAWVKDQMKKDQASKKSIKAENSFISSSTVKNDKRQKENRQQGK